MRIRTLTVVPAAWASAIGALVIAGYASVPAALAGHETRTADIQENGLDPLIVGLTIAAAVVGLVAFGVAMFVWEHRDDRAERSSSSDSR